VGGWAGIMATPVPGGGAITGGGAAIGGGGGSGTRGTPMGPSGTMGNCSVPELALSPKHGLDEPHAWLQTPMLSSKTVPAGQAKLKTTNRPEAADGGSMRAKSSDSTQR